MKLKKDDRRRFLKRGAAMAGVALGALRPASGQSSSGMSPDSVSPGKHLPYGVHSRFETTARDYSLTKTPYRMSGSAGTPLEDLHGIITPSPLHFVISHGATPPDFDPKGAPASDPGDGGPSFDLHARGTETPAFHLPDLFPGVRRQQLLSTPPPGDITMEQVLAHPWNHTGEPAAANGPGYCSRPYFARPACRTAPAG